MNDSYLLGFGIFVFVLLVIGLGLTIQEFSKFDDRDGDR